MGAVFYYDVKWMNEKEGRKRSSSSPVSRFIERYKKEEKRVSIAIKHDNCFHQQQKLDRISPLEKEERDDVSRSQ